MTTDLFEKKVSAKERIRRLLMERQSITNAEIAEHLRGTPGQLSWGQRVRELRQEFARQGISLTCEELKPGIYQYQVVMPKG